MSRASRAAKATSNKPTRQDRLRPLEFVGLSAVIALFTGLVVLGATRELTLALIFLGVAFIVSLVAIAMMSLAVKPDDAEILDLSEQDEENKRH